MNRKGKPYILYIFGVFLIFLGTAAAAAKFTDGFIIIGISLLILSILGSIIMQGLSKLVVRDIKHFIGEISKNGIMDLDDRQESGVFGEIQQNIGKITEGLKENFRKQVKMSTAITEASRELGEIVSDSEEVMKSIQASAEVTCDSSERQVHMLQEISKSAKDVIDSIGNMAEEMAQTVEFTEESISAAQNGIEQTVNIKNKMAGIKDVVVNTAMQIEELKQYSEKVVNMTELIRSIAQQTNMLALNASIEAARAGEHGRGFSVVADEVGKLSNQTTQVSDQISEIVDILQKEIVDIANIMKQETKHVETGYLEVESTIQRFNKINDSLVTSVERVRDMNDAIGNINARGQEIAAGIEEITQFSNEIYAQMEESQAQANLQNEKLTSLRAIADKLDKDADSMQQFIANRVMEGKMLKAVEYIKGKTAGKQITKESLNSLLKESKVDDILITDRNGKAKYCTDEGSIGLDLYSIDQSFTALRDGREKFVATPIKRRAEDGKQFKYLAIIDDGIIYQVGLSIDSVLKF